MSGAGWLLVVETRLDFVSVEAELVSDVSDVDAEIDVSSVTVTLAILVLLVDSEVVSLAETCLSASDISDEDKDKEADSLALNDDEWDSLALIELDSLALKEADSLALIDDDWLSTSLRLSEILNDVSIDWLSEREWLNEPASDSETERLASSTISVETVSITT
ncbi:TPA: hypothetical protein U0K61_001727 [Streptococcus suis]|nr:hypothetical protein [Streptococcus suis]